MFFIKNLLQFPDKKTENILNLFKLFLALELYMKDLLKTTNTTMDCHPLKNQRNWLHGLCPTATQDHKGDC